MKYAIVDGKVKLIKYEISGTDGEMEINEIAFTDEERDKLLELYPDATVTEVDNTGFEWMDGLTFTQEQRAAGEIELAAELGEQGYREYKDASDQNKVNAALLLEIAKLKTELKEVKGNDEGTN